MWPIVNENLFNSNNYLFTKIPLTWGWATWKDDGTSLIVILIME